MYTRLITILLYIAIASIIFIGGGLTGIFFTQKRYEKIRTDDRHYYNVIIDSLARIPKVHTSINHNIKKQKIKGKSITNSNSNGDN